MKKSEITKQIREKIGTLMTTAFGLVAALAWKDAIRTIFAKVFGSQDTIVGMLIYAIVVTVVAVIAIFVIAKSIVRQE